MMVPGFMSHIVVYSWRGEHRIHLDHCECHSDKGVSDDGNFGRAWGLPVATFRWGCTCDLSILRQSVSWHPRL